MSRRHFQARVFEANVRYAGPISGIIGSAFITLNHVTPPESVGGTDADLSPRTSHSKRTRNGACNINEQLQSWDNSRCA